MVPVSNRCPSHRALDPTSDCSVPSGCLSMESTSRPYDNTILAGAPVLGYPQVRIIFNPNSGKPREGSVELRPWPFAQRGPASTSRCRHGRPRFSTGRGRPRCIYRSSSAVLEDESRDIVDQCHRHHPDRRDCGRALGRYPGLCAPSNSYRRQGFEFTRSESPGVSNLFVDGCSFGNVDLVDSS